jgi:hypothetical protein
VSQREERGQEREQPLASGNLVPAGKLDPLMGGN